MTKIIKLLNQARKLDYQGFYKKSEKIDQYLIKLATIGEEGGLVNPKGKEMPGFMKAFEPTEEQLKNQNWLEKHNYNINTLLSEIGEDPADFDDVTKRYLEAAFTINHDYNDRYEARDKMKNMLSDISNYDEQYADTCISNARLTQNDLGEDEDDSMAKALGLEDYEDDPEDYEEDDDEDY